MKNYAGVTSTMLLKNTSSQHDSGCMRKLFQIAHSVLKEENRS